MSDGLIAVTTISAGALNATAGLGASDSNFSAQNAFARSPRMEPVRAIRERPYVGLGYVGFTSGPSGCDKGGADLSVRIVSRYARMSWISCLVS